MSIQIDPKPLSRTGRVMIVLIITILIAMWTLAIYAYFALPQKVPIHFGSDGEPTMHGDRSLFLIVPSLFSIAPVIFLLLTRCRFVLVNKYPYLVNLPAFFTKVPEEKKGFWVNKYFEVVLFLGAVVTFSLFIMELGIYIG